MKQAIIPIFVPHRGCPHTCVFCDQRRITGRECVPEAGEIIETIETCLKTMPEKYPGQVEVAFYGGSFTALDLREQESYLKLVQPYLKNKRVNSIRVSTRPDAVTPAILTHLQQCGVKCIELGVQSLDPEVLSLSKRGYSPRAVEQAVELVKKHGFLLGMQLMIGLPGDSREKDIETARRVVEMSPDIVRIYPTLVIRGTRLYRMYTEGRYRPLPLEEAVEITADMFIILDRADIKVIRMGLQPTRELITGESLAAGPFHPAFGELVESEVFLRQAAAAVGVWPGHVPGRGIRIFVNHRDISKMIGQRGRNRKKLERLLAPGRVEIAGIQAPRLDWVGVGPAGADGPSYVLYRHQFYHLREQC